MSSERVGALMRETFREATSNNSKWVCVLCIRAGVSEQKATYIIPKNKGYGNFYAHLNSEKHKAVWPDLLNAARVDKDKQKRRLESDDAELLPTAFTTTPDKISAFLVHKYGEKTISVYGHLEYLIDSKTVQPWTFCEDPMWRKHSKYGQKHSLCAKSLKTQSEVSSGAFQG